MPFGWGTCVSWVNGACGCERSGAGNTGTTNTTTTNTATQYGYPSRESQEAACRSGGGLAPDGTMEHVVVNAVAQIIQIQIPTPALVVPAEILKKLLVYLVEELA